MDFEKIKAALCDAAARAEVLEYEIYARIGESISAETLKDEISSFASGVGGSVSFRCVVDGKMGYASTEETDDEAMEALVLSAVSNARCIDSADEAIIFAGSEHYETVDNGPCELTDARDVRDHALRLQRAVYAESDKITDGTQTSVFSENMQVYLYNSYGLSLSNRIGVSGAYANAVVRDGEEAQEHFELGEGKDYAQFAPLAEKCVKGALEKIGADIPPSGEYDILFSGKQFRAFLSAFSSAFSAKQAQLGLSLLAGKEGERIAAEIVTITDDPMRDGSTMKWAFDGEGVATCRKNVVERGVLKTLLYNLITAKKAGRESTGNGQRGGGVTPYNFSLAAGKDRFDDMLASIENGIYITECKGFHAGANAVTGDFSIESAGFLIRNGKRCEPIKSFTVAGNFFDMLKNIDRISDTVEWGLPATTAFGSPAVLVRGMKVAGK